MIRKRFAWLRIIIVVWFFFPILPFQIPPFVFNSHFFFSLSLVFFFPGYTWWNAIFASHKRGQPAGLAVFIEPSSQTLGSFHTIACVLPCCRLIVTVKEISSYPNTFATNILWSAHLTRKLFNTGFEISPTVINISLLATHSPITKKWQVRHHLDDKFTRTILQIENIVDIIYFFFFSFYYALVKMSITELEMTEESGEEKKSSVTSIKVHAQSAGPPCDAARTRRVHLPSRVFLLPLLSYILLSCQHSDVHRATYFFLASDAQLSAGVSKVSLAHSVWLTERDRGARG